MSADDMTEMGPIDYILIEWQSTDGAKGEAAAALEELVDAGIVRILDFRMISKDADGSVSGVQATDADAISGLEDLLGAESGLLDDGDLQEAATALEPGATAALLVYENSWAGPFASAVRRSGGQLVANGRIPVQALLAALDAAEANA